METAADHEEPDLVVQVLLRVFSDASLTGTGALGPQESLSTLAALIPRVVECVPSRPLIPLLALILADQLKRYPAIIERELVLHLVESILSPAATTLPERKVSAITGVLLAADWRRLKDRDYVAISEKIASVTPRAYFKPHPDGAAHWTVALPIAQGVVCTVLQLDDAPALSAVAVLMALMFLELAPIIDETLLGVEVLPRTEIQINVVGQKDFELHIGREISGLTRALDEDFTVSQSSDVTRGNQPPIVVICGDAFGERWHPNVMGISKMHILFGQILGSVTAHLLAREVEMEVVRPKIVSIVRRISAVGNHSLSH